MNNKFFKKVFLSFILGVTLVCLTNCKNQKNIEKTFPEMVNELQSYKLTATLETLFENGSKECDVIVYFSKPNNYHIELTNKLANEKQIMIKNDKGVFIILPSINKTFKINSDWPTSSAQSYLLQNISKNILESENLLSTNENGKTTIELKTKLFENSNPLKEKIIFDDKSKLPTDIYIYRNNDELFNHISIKNIEKNPTLNNELFVVDNTITSARLDFISSKVEFDRSVTYPTYCPLDTKLFQEVITGDEKTKNVVMKFSGESPFTLVETYIHESDVIKNEYFSGDIYLMAGSFALVANNTFKFYTEGIEYTIASNELSFEEVILVAHSLGNSDIK